MYLMYLFTLYIPIPAPEWDSVFSFVHKFLHLIGNGRPVWPIEITLLRVSCIA